MKNLTLLILAGSVALISLVGCHTVGKTQGLSDRAPRRGDSFTVMEGVYLWEISGDHSLLIADIGTVDDFQRVKREKGFQLVEPGSTARITRRKKVGSYNNGYFYLYFAKITHPETGKPVEVQINGVYRIPKGGRIVTTYRFLKPN